MRSAHGRQAATRSTTCDTAADDVAIIAFTSGTTGDAESRDALPSRRSRRATRYGAHVLRPQRDDLFCGSPPLAFTFGLGGLLLFPLYAGAATLLLEKAGPEELLRRDRRVRRHDALHRADRVPHDGGAGGPVRPVHAAHVRVGRRDAARKPIWDAWHAATGLKILDGIGSTEMLHIFIGSRGDEVRPGSTGRAVPGYVAEIHDDDGRPLPAGDVGRLAVKGPTGCKYLRRRRARRSTCSDGWNYPGDAYRGDDDGYFWYVARTDDMIVSAGLQRLGPGGRARAARARRDVKECRRRRPSTMLERSTNIVKAFVVLVDGCDANDEKIEELREFCKAQIAPFKAPREIEFVDALPRTETGKVTALPAARAVP